MLSRNISGLAFAISDIRRAGLCSGGQSLKLRAPWGLWAILWSYCSLFDLERSWFLGISSPLFRSCWLPHLSAQHHTYIFPGRGFRPPIMRTIHVRRLRQNNGCKLEFTTVAVRLAPQPPFAHSSTVPGATTSYLPRGVFWKCGCCRPHRHHQSFPGGSASALAECRQAFQLGVWLQSQGVSNPKAPGYCR